MTHDFGHSRRRKKPPYGWIAAVIVVFIGLSAAVFVPSWIKHRNEAIADAGKLALSGPPCPVLSEAEFAKGYSTPNGLTFGEVRFERQYGHASCNTLRYEGGKALATYPACQFMSPAVLTVVSEKGRFHFLPGLGKDATVFVEHGQPRCVMAINKALF
jgi:hypothetical protein